MHTRSRVFVLVASVVALVTTIPAVADDVVVYDDALGAGWQNWSWGADVDLAASYFYTDSISDLPLVERVGHPVAVNPDLRLRRLARKRGWPLEIF